MPHNVLIVDDNDLVRRLLRSWLELQPEWEICGEAENGKLAIEKVKELHPDIVILDLQMPVMNGLEAAREIKRLSPNTAMIIFTVHASYELVKEARAHGVRDVVSKCDMLGERLLSALRQACAYTAQFPKCRRCDWRSLREESIFIHFGHSQRKAVSLGKTLCPQF